MDDAFILILITCKYAHFWDFTVYKYKNVVMLEPGGRQKYSSDMSTTFFKSTS